MRNFRKVLLLVVIIVIYECIFSFLLEPVTYQHFLEMELKEDEKRGICPDMVVIGNSCTEMDVIPSVLEREMEGVSCVLNAGTGSQMIWGTYYYLKDLLGQYDIKYVVVGIDYSTFIEADSYVPKRELVVLDRIRSMAIKAEYLNNCLQWEDYMQVIKSYRYRENIGSISENLRAKLDRNYWEGTDIREDAHYQERGYVYTEERGELRTGIYSASEWDGNRVSEKAMEYLNRIVELCREEDVELFLTAMPLSFSGIYGSGTYQSANDYFSRYAAEQEVPFLDLSLLLNRTEVLPDSMLSDEGHLGGNGAIVCSEWLGKILSDQIAGKDISGYFYGSVEEMKEDIEGIAACDFSTQPYGEAGDRVIKARSIHAEGVVPEYEYWIIREGGEWMKLQEYSENAECLIPAEYLGGEVTIQVRCRKKGDTLDWERQMQRSREPGME